LNNTFDTNLPTDDTRKRDESAIDSSPGSQDLS